MNEYVKLKPTLKTALRSIYDEDRKGNHFSDIVLCPRQRVFRDKQKIPVSDRELNFFTSGKAIHEAIEALYMKYPNRFGELEVWISLKTKKIHKVLDPEGQDFLYRIKLANTYLRHLQQMDNLSIDTNSMIKEIEKAKENLGKEYEFYLNKNGIYPSKGDLVAHIDLYDRKNNQPYEAKSSRTAGLKEPKGFHVQQLKQYMAVLGSDNGGVFYQFLFNFGEDPFGEFPIQMNEDQRKEMLEYIVSEGRNLNEARKLGRPELARHIMNDINLNWKCVKTDFKTKEKKVECPYYNQCYKINFPESTEIKLI